MKTLRLLVPLLLGCTPPIITATTSVPVAAADAGAGQEPWSPPPLPTAADASFDAGPPAGFVPTEIGGYRIGAPGDDPGPPTAASGCREVVGVVRDLRGAGEPDPHPDFEAFVGVRPTPGLVLPDLGPDGRPAYAARCDAASSAGCPEGRQLTTREAFDGWYRSTPGVTQPFLLYLTLEDRGGTATFSSDRFFPVDGVGWGPSGKDEDGKDRNFGFTTELHLRFLFQGGEHFTFMGDDDVWIYANGHLVVDLGGSHDRAVGVLDLDRQAASLGLTPGGTYPLDVFQAERHTRASRFRIESSLSLVGCGEVIR